MLNLLSNTHMSILLLVLGLWTIPWKGWALWISARKGERWWFVALLLINTIGILEIIYIFFISKRTPRNTEIA